LKTWLPGLTVNKLDPLAPHNLWEGFLPERSNKMFKNILVPLDSSKRAEAILPHVEELARNNNAQVNFLQVVEPQYVFTGPEGYTFEGLIEISHEAEQERANLYLKDLVEKFREKGIQAISFVEYGSIAHSILKTAQRENIDLIAMASHGRTGLAHVFYGSVAASVLHLVDRPLLLVRA
jgi:nucleotide-binding universal stress UspA family protein